MTHWLKYEFQWKHLKYEDCPPSKFYFSQVKILWTLSHWQLAACASTLTSFLTYDLRRKFDDPNQSRAFGYMCLLRSDVYKVIRQF